MTLDPCFSLTSISKYVINDYDHLHLEVATHGMGLNMTTLEKKLMLP